MSDENEVQDPHAHDPHIKVVKGEPTEEELAAVIAVVATDAPLIRTGADRAVISALRLNHAKLSRTSGATRWTGCATTSSAGSGSR